MMDRCYESNMGIEHECKPKTCKWKVLRFVEYDGGEIKLSCRPSILFLAAESLKQSQYKFCPFCGGKIVEVG